MTSEANGALMRLTPLIVWAAPLPTSSFIQCMRKDAMMTHPSKTCQDCNVAYGIAIRHLLAHPQDGAGALVAVHSLANRMCSKVMEWLAASTSIQSNSCTTNIGHVKHAFVLAFYCLRKELSFAKAIQTTLEMGGDTDTNAAIVGGMMGAYWGAHGIPRYMRDPVLSHDCTKVVSANKHGRQRGAVYNVHANVTLFVEALGASKRMRAPDRPVREPPTSSTSRTDKPCVAARRRR